MPFDAEYIQLPKAEYIQPPKAKVQYGGFLAMCGCPECVRGRMLALPLGKVEDLRLLKAARQRILEGWTQKTAFNVVTEGVCSVAALICAFTGNRVPDVTTNRAPDIDRMARLLPGINSAQELIRFNDHRETQKHDVLRLFDCGIAALERSL
jgi:hypothetical protein